jgi:hypothetical protein
MSTGKKGLQFRKRSTLWERKRAMENAQARRAVRASQSAVTEAADEFLKRHHTPEELRSIGILPIDADDPAYEDVLAGFASPDDTVFEPPKSDGGFVVTSTFDGSIASGWHVADTEDAD